MIQVACESWTVMSTVAGAFDASNLLTVSFSLRNNVKRESGTIMLLR
jgi:hypothetical protein